MTRALFILFGVVAFLWMVMVFVACGGPPLPPCSAQEKALVEAEFIEEATRICDGYELEECEAFPAIDRKYSERRLAVRKGCR